MCRYIIITGSDIFIAFKMMVIQLVRLRNPFFFVRSIVCLFAQKCSPKNWTLKIKCFFYGFNAKMISFHLNAEQPQMGYDYRNMSQVVFYVTFTLLFTCILKLLFTVNRLITFSNRWMQSFFLVWLKWLIYVNFFLFISFLPFCLYLKMINALISCW